MPASVYNLTIERGADFRLRLKWKQPSGDPVDLTGRTAKMQLRARAGDPNVVIELSTENGRITLGGVAGTIDLFVAAADTIELPVRTLKHDLYVILGASADRLIEGDAYVSQEITVIS